MAKTIRNPQFDIRNSVKSASAAFKTHLDGEVTTLCECWKIVIKKFQPKIVEISRANPGVVTTKWPHGFTTGRIVKLVDVQGMTEVNGNEYAVQVIDGTSFSIGVDTSGFSAYINKGEARRVLGYTTHIEDRVFEGVTYKAQDGYSASGINSKDDLSVDDLQILGILNNDDMKIEDIEAGKWDDFEAESFLLNYLDLTQGKMMLPAGGNAGEIETRQSTYVAELRGLQHYLDQEIGSLFSVLCRADLGDSLCKVRLDPPKWRPSTAYTVRPASDAGLGSAVRPTVYNGRQFECSVLGTSGATEPVWNLTLGGSTVDGTATWKTIDAWTKESTITSVVDRGKFGDTARTEDGDLSLSWPIKAVSVAAKQFQIDGNETGLFKFGILFKVQGSTGNDRIYRTASASYSAGPNRTTITVQDEIADPTVAGQIQLDTTGWWTYGLMTMLSGLNAGIAREVKRVSYTAYAITAVSTSLRRFTIAGNQTANFSAGETIRVTGSTGNNGIYTISSVTFSSPNTWIVVNETVPSATVDGSIQHKPSSIELFEKFPYDLKVGDKYEIQAGCDKQRSSCIAKHNNIFNMRAEPDIPGLDAMLMFPDAKA